MNTPSTAFIKTTELRKKMKRLVGYRLSLEYCSYTAYFVLENQAPKRAHLTKIAKG